MKPQLKGKIYWVLEDFAYIGAVTPKTGDTLHIVARITNVIIEEHMIKFFVCPFKGVDGEEWSYNVNLQPDDTGTKFNGFYSEGTEPSHKGEVNSELFSNSKKHIIYGRWFEDELIYTFWALIEKE